MSEPAEAGESNGRAPLVVTLRPGGPDAAGSGQVSLRHTKRLTYRCFLPDLAGLVRSRCAGPGPRCCAHRPDPDRRRLGGGFSPAGADCGYREPL